MMCINKNLNIIKKVIVFFLILFATSCSNKKKEITSKDICNEELPIFIEKFNGNYDTVKLKLLCTCIWNSFPEDGWERKISRKLYNGEDIGWKIKSFSTTFEFNLKKCKSKIK